MDSREIESGDSNRVLGNMVEVGFVSLGAAKLQGKVDTGATTSSLHASNVSINQDRNTVTFRCEELSPNMITLDLSGVQEVHSADHGGEKRPIVKLDVTINGVPLRGVSFNLNDRSNMDTRILIGQNILQAGKFVIDPSKDNERVEQPRTESMIMQAIETLVECNVSLADIVKYLHTAAVNRIKD